MKKGIEHYTDVAVKGLPLLTVLTFIFGYIGFHTLTAIYSLPIINTDISTIVSIGVLNITYLVILYLMASPKRKPTYFMAFVVFTIFVFFLNNPILISFTIAFLFSLYHFNIDSVPKHIPFSERRIKVKRYHQYLLWSNKIILLVSLAIATWVDGNFFLLLVLIYVSLFFIHRYKRYNEKIDIFKIVYIILFPVITMYYFINSSKENILGINSQRVEIITKTDTLTTEIIFNDEKFFYTFCDSTKKMTAIKKDDVLKMISKTDRNGKRGFIKEFKDDWKEFFSK